MAKRQCYWCGVWSTGKACDCCGDDLDQQEKNRERWERERWERERQERLEKTNRRKGAEVRQN